MSPKKTNQGKRSTGQILLSALDLPPVHVPYSMTSPLPMQIQNAQPDDLVPIQDLLSTLDLPHRDLVPSDLEDFLVCRDDEEIVGVVGLERYKTVALLRSLAVRPSHRDSGIGTRLVEAIERHGRQRDVDVLYLLTTTAAGYFARRDYDVVDRDALPVDIQETEEATRLCPSSATAMQKDLST